MRIGNLVHQQLQRLIRRYPKWRWPLILLSIVLIAIFGKIDARLPGRARDENGTEVVAGFAKIIDGDSLRIGSGEIRLKDIDAPEGRQTCRRNGAEWDCGEEARRTLQRLIGGQKVTCRSVERDKHNRLLGYCEAGGRSLNEAMVASGFAVSYGGYRDKERAAKSGRLGLWGSEFEMPREWRRQRGIGR